MEYIVIVLLLSIIAIMFFKNPNAVMDKIIDDTIDEVIINEHSIADGAYEKLPEDVKKYVSKAVVSYIVSHTIKTAIDTLKMKKTK